jgi:nitrogen fixation protein FixH
MKTLIVVVTLIGLAAVLGAIVVGTRSFEGVVVEKPYETGLLWDAAEKEKAAIGWKVELRTKMFRPGENQTVLQVFDKDGNPLSGAEVSVVVSRPSTNAYDRVYSAAGLSGGIYETPVQLPLFGHWDLRVSVTSNGKTAVFHERIFAERG